MWWFTVRQKTGTLVREGATLTWVVLVIVLFIVYLVAGFSATARASAFLHDRQKLYTASPLVRPELYRSEGDAYRRRALQVWYVGGLLFLGVLIVASVWTRR